jgi:aspartyl protease family protein
MMELDHNLGRAMRQVLVLFLLAGAIGLGLARYADHAALALAVKPAPAPAQPAPTGSRTATRRRDGRGHFQVEARVEGRRMDFMVDTGASMIAMRESSAARLGIHPRVADYTVKTQTANGVGRAARVHLNSVEVRP